MEGGGWRAGGGHRFEENWSPRMGKQCRYGSECDEREDRVPSTEYSVLLPVAGVTANRFGDATYENIGNPRHCESRTSLVDVSQSWVFSFILWTVLR